MSVSDGGGSLQPRIGHVRTAASHLRDPQTNDFLFWGIYGCLVDRVNQIMSVILTGR